MSIDNSPRPTRAFDKATTGLDRRQILKAAGWAAPVILVAAAAPAASASVTITGNVISVAELDAVVNNNPGELRVRAVIPYNPNAWSGGAIGAPASGTVSFRVDLINAQSETSATDEVTGVVIAANDIYQYAREFTALPAGVYTVNLTVTSIVFPPPYGQTTLPSATTTSGPVP